MTRTIPNWAKADQYLTLAKQLIAEGTSREDALAWLKAHNYIVNNYKYQATEVLHLMQLWEDISNGIKSGKIKATKKTGLVLTK